MESKQNVPAAVLKVHQKIDKLYEGNDQLKNSEKDLEALGSAMAKMFGRFEEDNT